MSLTMVMNHLHYKKYSLILFRIGLESFALLYGSSHGTAIFRAHIVGRSSGYVQKNLYQSHSFHQKNGLTLGIAWNRRSLTLAVVSPSCNLTLLAYCNSSKNPSILVLQPILAMILQSLSKKFRLNRFYL